MLTEKDISELRDLEESLWREETRFDMHRMREIIAEDFFEFGRSGHCYSLEDTLAIAPQKIHAKIPLPDFNVRQLAEDVVQVTYSSAVEYNNKILHARRSSLWSRNQGHWRLRFHQGTPYEPDTQ